MQKVTLIVYYLLSLVFGGAGAWIISIYGRKLGLLDKPNERSSHYRLTPKGGGIGILPVFIFVSLFAQIPFTFWIPAAILALMSFFGDKHDFSPKIRLPMQFIAALILLSPAMFPNSSINLCPLSSVLCLLPLSVFIVGTANIYNFMDGINGISAITGIVGFGLLAVFSFLSEGNNSFTLLSICISLSCLGFLPFNMPKARVFMGDVGSILLGFVFAGMVVVLSKSFLDFICLASFLFPFYADELFTMTVRLREGENLLRPHRRHLYQLLANEKGIAHWKVSAGYGMLQLLVGVSVLLLGQLGSVMILLLLAAYFGAFIVVSATIRRNLATSA